MAAIQDSTAHSTVPTLAQTIQKTQHIWQEWWSSRRSMHSARNLDDRLLKDIGLTRSDVGLSDHQVSLADASWFGTMLDGRDSSRRNR